jgi:hypothetical protein
MQIVWPYSRAAILYIRRSLTQVEYTMKKKYGLHEWRETDAFFLTEKQPV